MERDSRPARAVLAVIDRLIIPGLQKRGVSPDRVTAAGAAHKSGRGSHVSVLPPWRAACWSWLPAVCDMTDGRLARALSMASPRGAYTDSVLDRWSEALVMIGLYLRLARFPGYETAGGLLLLAALAGSLLVSYTRARGEALGVGNDSGRFTRSDRLIVIIAGSLLDPLAPGLILTITAGVLALGTNVAAVLRFADIRGRLPGPK